MFNLLIATLSVHSTFENIVFLNSLCITKFVFHSRLSDNFFSFSRMYGTRSFFMKRLLILTISLTVTSIVSSKLHSSQPSCTLIKKLLTEELSVDCPLLNFTQHFLGVFSFNLMLKLSNQFADLFDDVTVSKFSVKKARNVDRRIKNLKRLSRNLMLIN